MSKEKYLIKERELLKDIINNNQKRLNQVEKELEEIRKNDRN